MGVSQEELQAEADKVLAVGNTISVAHGIPLEEARRLALGVYMQMEIAKAMRPRERKYVMYSPEPIERTPINPVNVEYPDVTFGGRHGKVHSLDPLTQEGGDPVSKKSKPKSGRKGGRGC